MLSGVARLVVNPSSFVTSCVYLPTRAPSLLRHYSLSSVLRAHPPPKRPGLALTSNQWIPTADHHLDVPCCIWSPMHAVANTPAGSMNLLARTVASTSAFPLRKEGQPLHFHFRGLHGIYTITAYLRFDNKALIGKPSWAEHLVGAHAVGSSNQIE